MQLRADLALTPELVAFRDDLRRWLDRHLTEEFKADPLSDPTGSEGDAFERRRAWQRVLHRGGWVGVHWPADYGGRGATLAEYALFLVTCGEAGAPEPVNQIGLNMVGPTLIDHGTPAQRALLPGILSADTIWCQLFSEPEAGSDLGAIRARARRRPDGGWAVSGQKVWTSLGPMADLGLLLA
ncbi:MAG TPA: acyl-CoA dehydrogenase family protein, partial [Acidimicrobiia bacterium]|nr:acyl-CoA dehydrogenase family protein [Acidimicrobiia bacterium]